MWNSPAFLGIIAGLSSLIPMIIGYRRSIRSDEVAAKSGIVANQFGAAEQVIGALKLHIESLQSYNEVLQTENTSLRQQLALTR